MQTTLFSGLKDTMGVTFMRGTIAGVFASVVTQPADVVKTNLQLFPSRSRNKNLNAIKSIYISHGLPGFFTGLVPRLVRRTLVSALSWTVYEKVGSIYLLHYSFHLI